VNGVDLPDTVVPVVEDLATVTIETGTITTFIPFTGAETLQLLGAAIGLLTLGGGLVLLSRRRKPAPIA